MSDRDLTEAIEAAACEWWEQHSRRPFDDAPPHLRDELRHALRPVVEAVAEALAADACPDPAAHEAVARVVALAEDAEQWAREAADAPDYGRGRVDLVCEWVAKRIRTVLDPEAGSARETPRTGHESDAGGESAPREGRDAAEPGDVPKLRWNPAVRKPPPAFDVQIDEPTDVELPDRTVRISEAGLWRIDYPSGKLTRLSEGRSFRVSRAP